MKSAVLGSPALLVSELVGPGLGWHCWVRFGGAAAAAGGCDLGRVWHGQSPSLAPSPPDLLSPELQWGCALGHPRVGGHDGWVECCSSSDLEAPARCEKCVPTRSSCRDTSGICAPCVSLSPLPKSRGNLAGDMIYLCMLRGHVPDFCPAAVGALSLPPMDDHLAAYFLLGGVSLWLLRAA